MTKDEMARRFEDICKACVNYNDGAWSKEEAFYTILEIVYTIPKE